MWVITQRDKDRFSSKYKVNSSTGCWDWLAAIGYHGYGVIGFNKKTELAHRLSYAIHKGTIGGLFVLHRCDNRECVNPEHLFLGTTQDNVDDKVSKGRQYRPLGELSHTSSLTEQNVILIKKRLKQGDTHLSISMDYGVSRCTITDINLGRAWSSVQAGG